MLRPLISNAGLFILTWTLFSAIAVSADEKADSQQLLKEKGFKLVGTVAAATEETDVEKAFKSLKTSYSTVIDAKKRLTQVEQEIETNRDMIKQLTGRRMQLRQLMDSQTTVSARNAVVSQFNACTDELNLRITNDQNGDALAKAKAVYSTPRNAYLKNVIAMRELIDKTDAKYKTAGDDSSLETAIAAASKAEGKKITLGPTKDYVQNVKLFARYEAMIMSDSIPLERRSGTYMIDVILNGKDPVKMVFDTGASSISLSYEMAAKAGLKQSDPSTKVKVTIANGRTVEAKKMKLASVRVGKFEIKNVDCVVMPEDLPESPPLLGGAFLNNFKYEIDADASKVRLTRLDGAGKSPGK